MTSQNIFIRFFEAVLNLSDNSHVPQKGFPHNTLFSRWSPNGIPKTSGKSRYPLVVSKI